LKIGQHLPKLWAVKYRVVFYETRCRRETPKLESSGAPLPCSRGAADLEICPSPMCYPANFGHSRSNGTSLIKEIHLFDPSLPAFQGHSRSSEPTRIDPPPMTSYKRSIATMGLSCTVPDINGDCSRESQIFPAPCILHSQSKRSPWLVS